MRLQELDSVELTRDLPSFVRGTRGVVVLVYPSGKQVEVEFLNPKGDTLGVESVPTAFLRKVPRAPKPKAAPRKVSSQELVKLLAQEGNVSEESASRILKLLGRLAAQKRVTWKAIIPFFALDLRGLHLHR
jgi:hypothetical protein